MRLETTQEIKKISDGLNKNINVKACMAQSTNKVMMEGVKVKFCQNGHLKNSYLALEKRP